MPRRKSSIADDLVLLPWWVSVVLAVLVYTILPALVPQAAGFAGIIALGLLAIAAISALRSRKTRRMLDQQTGIDSIRELPWKRFEDLLGEAYRRQGYKVEETLGGGADGGVDLVLGRSGQVTLVQMQTVEGKTSPRPDRARIIWRAPRSRRERRETGGHHQLYLRSGYLRQRQANRARRF